MMDQNVKTPKIKRMKLVEPWMELTPQTHVKYTYRGVRYSVWKTVKDGRLTFGFRVGLAPVLAWRFDTIEEATRAAREFIDKNSPAKEPRAVKVKSVVPVREAIERLEKRVASLEAALARHF